MFSGCSPDVVLYKNHNNYGEMWFVNENGTTTNLTGTDVYNNITGMSDGYNNGLSLINGNYLNVSQAGLYKIDYGISFKGGNNQLYGMAIGINGIAQQNRCYAHRTTTSNAVGNVGSSCIMNLTKGNRITLMIADESGVVASPDIYMAGLAILRVGS